MPNADIKRVFSKIRELTGEAVQPAAIRPVALEAITIVRRRVRLGYGASEDGGERSRLKPLSPAYVKFRGTRGSSFLSEFTTPGRSNLTFTGQMLDSLTILQVRSGKITIGPSGTRSDPFSRGKTNQQIAAYVTAQGRPWLFLTKPEVSQLVRFYRTTFGDLARRRGLT